MEQCAMCLQDLKINNVDNLEVKLKCNHKFHKMCIEKHSVENNCCPLCGRLLINFTFISSKFEQPDYIIVPSKYNDYSLIHLHHYNIKCYKPFVLKQSPQLWIDYPDSNTLLPLYCIRAICNTEVVIDFHLRQHILLGTYDNNALEIISNIDSKQRLYYYSSSGCILEGKLTYDFNRDISIATVSWIYDVMIFVCDKYNFIYYNSINTLIFDLVIMTLNDINSNSMDDIRIVFKQKSKLQVIILAAIYSSCMFYGTVSIEFNIDVLIDLSDNSTDKEELQDLCSIFNRYLCENFIKM